jgi:hypothetical protein
MLKVNQLQLLETHPTLKVYSPVAIASAAHAEGFYTTASGFSSHAEGQATLASNQSAHAEGFLTTASGFASHASGYETIAINDFENVAGRLIDLYQLPTVQHLVEPM